MTRRRVLTAPQIAEIRSKYLAHVPGRGYLAIARQYGVGASTIRDLITGRVRGVS